MMVFDREKLKKLVHYIIWKTNGKDGFGATKLYKVMWFSEARSYVMRKKPITGAVYIKQKFGPVPKDGAEIRDELVREGKIGQRLVPRGGYQEWIFSNKFPPDQDFLTAEERQDVDYWINHIDKDHTATSISDFTHDDAWGIAKIGEPLPHYAILIERLREPNDRETETIKKRAKELGLM